MCFQCGVGRCRGTVQVDCDDRRTPGSRFCYWEARGILLRVEIGIREAANGTACLWLHPLLSGLIHEAQQKILDHTAPGESPDLKQAGPRLSGIPVDALPTVCGWLLASIAIRFPGSSMHGTVEIDRVVDHTRESWANATAGGAGAAQRATPSPLCQKLHIGHDPGASTGLCVAHLRYLVGVGKPCHCLAHQHISAAGLKALVEVGYAAASPSGKGKVVRWPTGGDTAAAEMGCGTTGPVAVVVANLPVPCNAFELTAQLSEAFASFKMLNGAAHWLPGT